jgi:putative DNA primase/helicase
MSAPKWNPEDYEHEIRKEVERISKPKRQRENGGERRGHREHARTSPTVLPPPNMPMEVARAFVAKHCIGDDLTLRHWRGGWWAWQGSHWVERENRQVRSLLYAFTEHALYVAGKSMAPWAPNRHKIGDLLEALSAVCILPDQQDQPHWIDGRATGTIVAVANGLLDLERRQLLPHTPLFFNQVAVPFEYDATAAKPERWLAFLAELWPDEPEAIDVLAEWFGYVISGLLNLHKILLMVGPTRGGKGVIARILTELVGRQNTAGPTLHSLGGDFGLAPLIGKSLAVISDARFVGKNGQIVVERLLSISGEDTLTVNRKYKDQWTGKLPSRIHIISNELPKLGDASTAIVGRIVLLLTSRSWLGHEDFGLELALHAELPGILNWALDGLERLSSTNQFTRLASADEAITTMRDLASPVAAFAREKCEIGADKEVAVDVLYAAYKVWAEDNGHQKATKQSFGRDLRAAVPAVRKTRPRDETGRPHVYTGIALRSAQDGL